MRAIPALVAIALLVAAAVFVADRPGNVAIAWQGWEIDTSVAVLVLAGVVFAVIVAVAWNIVRAILRGPGAWSRARREKRRREGYRALTQGMVAVAAGDAEEAQKLARKADSLLAEPPLTLLLSAQAAQLNGDETAAGKYFTAMLDRPETEFLGLRGLLMQALRNGDEATALRLAERAKTLRPKTPWVLQHLLELQARAGHWPSAEATLVEVSRRKALPEPDSRHRHAVLLHEHATEADGQGRISEAMRLEARAHRLEPAFAPIAAKYARMLLLRGQQRRARRTLEEAWRMAPHPLIAEVYGTIYHEEPPLLRVKRFEKLAGLNPSHVESHLALARANLAARLWGEARRHLSAAQGDGEANTPPRVARLMAELEEAERDDHGASHVWLGRAANAAMPDPAWVCDACGAEAAQWSALCPSCHSFATLVWRQGERPAPERRALEHAMAQPVQTARLT